MSAQRRPLHVALALLIAAALADVTVHLLLLRDGSFRGWPLPPFGALTHPDQEAWLAELEPGRDRQGLGRFDAELGWTWNASARSPDGLFTTGVLGARGPREYARAKPAGVTRVVCFGDSFTFGDEIQDTWTFEHILESFRPDVEALNFGVSGYGTDQALLRYRRLGRDLGADVVCIGLLLENIGRNVNRYRPLWNTRTGFCATKPRFVLGASGELELIPQPYATREELADAVRDGSVLEAIAEHEHWTGPGVPTGRLSSLGRLLGGALAYRARSPERLWCDVDGEAFAVTVTLLETFHREALADGARLAPVLVFPSKQELVHVAEGGERYWTPLLDALAERGVPALDLAVPLAAKHRECLADPGLGTVYYGGHLSSVGNAVVARAVEEWLAAQ
jgi:lysophospholipase L1-like esterase